MSVKFVTVQWTKRKIVYDLIALGTIAAYITLFTMLGRKALTGAESITPEILKMRTWGSCAFLLLTFILTIGPLARLDRRFLPLLYNRRHLGVMMSVVASIHAYQVLGYYHAFGSLPQLVSLFTNDVAFTQASLPFQLFGAAALLIIVVMAAISHDFWQKTLGPQTWKTIHMLVYVAYALIVVHVAFGPMQWEVHPGFAAMVAGCAGAVGILHVAAAIKSSRLDGRKPRWLERDGTRWLDAGTVSEIEKKEGRACPVVVPNAERIALVCHQGKVSAIHGVCAHQGGPLYEGRVIDGCLTCPWHGWQYKAEDGQSPPPFTEKLPTYRVRVDDDRVWVDPAPLPPGTPVAPVALRGRHD